jgi:TPR repeat protein
MSKKKTAALCTTLSLAYPVRWENEEVPWCCLCSEDLSKDDAKNMRVTCCGKQWHLDCQIKVTHSNLPDDRKYRCHGCWILFPLPVGKAWAQTLIGLHFQLGTCGRKQSNLLAAASYKKAVKGGDTQAMILLARLYLKGQGVAQSFQKGELCLKGQELFTMAAKKGEVEAMVRLGAMYQQGIGGVYSHEKAAEHYTMAAGQGDAKAMFALGCMRRDGKGVVKSYKEAAELFTMAAKQGNIKAMLNLGVLYLHGRGVDQSSRLAFEWLTKAADKGNECAVTNLIMLDEFEGRPTFSPQTQGTPGLTWERNDTGTWSRFDPKENVFVALTTQTYSSIHRDCTVWPRTGMEEYIESYRHQRTTT